MYMYLELLISLIKSQNLKREVHRVIKLSHDGGHYYYYYFGTFTAPIVNLHKQQRARGRAAPAPPPRRARAAPVSGCGRRGAFCFAPVAHERRLLFIRLYSFSHNI